jgi:cell division septation protein DedD
MLRISTSRTRILAATMLCALTAAAAGCGSSSEKFSSGEADRALAALDATQQAVDEGRCTAAERRVQVLISQASRINSDRPDLGAAYARSAERLQQLVARECVNVKETGPTGESTSPTGATHEPTKPTGPTEAPQTPNPEPTGGGAPNPPPGQQNNDNNSPGDSGGARPG